MSNYSAHIEKSEISGMPTVAFEGRIITIDTVADTDKAVKALSNEKILGIDTETRPSFRKGVQYEVSLIQLSTADTCFLIRLNRVGIPDSLISLLENKEITKIFDNYAKDGVLSRNALKQLAL